MIVDTLLLSTVLMISSGFAFENDAHTVALWHCDEGSGNILRDASGNDHDGELNGGAGWDTKGASGSCLSLDGINDYVEVPTKDDLIPLKELTLELWVKISDYPPTHFALLSKSDNYHGGSGYLWGIENTGKPKCYFRTTDWKFSQTQVPLDEWVYLAVTISQKKLRYYLNGKETDHFAVDTKNDNASTELKNNDFPLIIGRTENTNIYFLNGLLDEIRISDIVRSAKEINDTWLRNKGFKQKTSVIFLKNGDKISGEIITPVKIAFETPYGLLDVPLIEITTVEFGDNPGTDLMIVPSGQFQGSAKADSFYIQSDYGKMTVRKEQIQRIEH
ncbi:MAG TPA: LamG domain-containing protein [bacterium]